MLSEITQARKRQIPYDFIDVQTVKEKINETEAESQIQRTDQSLPQEREVGVKR